MPRLARLIRIPPGFGQPRQAPPPRTSSGITARVAALPLAALMLALGLAPARAAGPIEVVSADGNGVTLRLTVAPYGLGPEDEDGRRELKVERLDLYDVPGRPRLPYATTMIALPPGARAVATLIEGPEEVVEGVRLTIGDRPVLRADQEGTEYIAMREPVDAITDGAWPRTAVEVGEPYTVRRQRVVVVQLQPYRYDVTAARLWTRRTMTVRVRFEGGSAAAVPAAPAAEDRGWEPLLAGTVANYEQGRRWREPRPALSRGLFDRTTGARAGTGALGAAAFDEDEPEVRVRIASTGVWALDAAELFARGYPAGVPIAEVSVHRHEYVPGIQAPNPPYVTFEIPIEVDDVDRDLSFSDGDRIVLFAQSWWERSGLAYQLPLSHAQRLWGESDYVYATRVRAPRAGLRVPERSGWNGLTLTPLTSYLHYQRFEQNTSYLSAPRDTSQDAYQWITRPLYASPTELPFEVTSLDTSVRASVGATWTGLLNSYSHFVWAQVRNAVAQTTTVVDSAFASGKVTVTRFSSIHGSALSNGTNNRFRIWGKRSNAPIGPDNRYPDIALGHFDIAYGRAYRPIQGYLACNNGTATGDYEIFATGFTDSSSLRVYDVTDSSAIQRLSATRKEPDAGGFGVRFQDNAPGRRRYVVFDAPKRPAATDYGVVDRAAITNLYSRGTGDYLLIVPEAFQGAVGPLVTLRTSQGLDVIVAPLGAVNDAFNGGRKSAWAIKRFIQYAYANWDARFVLLMGDGSQDPTGVSPLSSKDWVPTQRILGPVLASGTEESFLEAIVSDAWYVWCVDCGSPLQPKIPDLHIGRLPVNSLAEASALVNKLVSYENVSAADTWRRKMVLMSDDMYSGANTFGGDIPQIGYCRRRDEVVFQTINQRCRSIVLDEAGLRQSEPEIFNLSYYVPTYPSDLTCAQPSPPDTCRCAADMTDNIYISRARSYAQPALFSRLAEGRLWFNFQGHANERVLAHEAFYSNGYGRLGDDKGLLTNAGRPFLFTAFSCHPNAFGHYQEGSATRGGPALGEDLVNLPTTGAIASWGSAGFELLPTSSSRHINVEFARALFVDLPRNPKEFDGQGGARAVLGEVISYATIVYNQPGHLPTGSPYERDVGISYNLLGDPATRVTVGSPQNMFLANQTPIVDGVPVRLHTLGDTLRLEGDVASNARLDNVWLERVEGENSAVVPPGDYTLTPAFPDTTIASGGGRRYHLLYRTQLVPRTHTYRIHTVDRYGTPGRLDAVFQLQSTLSAEGGVVSDNDLLAPTAQLALLLISPSPLVPANDIRISLDGANMDYVPTPANNDVSGREWSLALVHDPFLAGDHRIEVSVQGVVQASHRFRVHSELRLDNAMAFPNPFNDESGAAFSYYLGGDRPANVRLRVFTITGRLIFEREFASLPVGYHQFHWNGTDAEGRSLANGVYFYRLAADNGGSSSRYEGRIVKLAKPTVVPEEVVP